MKTSEHKGHMSIFSIPAPPVAMRITILVPFRHVSLVY
jgi:hypothetical protein